MKICFAFILFICLSACETTSDSKEMVKLVTVDPGHFHAALVQKTMYDGVDSVAYVYAPEGTDLYLHLSRIEAYNNRMENPTHWSTEIYTGSDFFSRMTTEKKGNVVVLSGNNMKKTKYIYESLQAGMHVLTDKPMAINNHDFKLLRQSFAAAKQNNLLLYDIMTERYEITTMLQRELSQVPEIFGQLEKGTLENPAITKESVHHFYKYVSGNVLTRPAWFMDVEQQGEGLVDVMTHLVDLVQWECFPNQILDTIDVQVVNAKRWSTSMSLEQFKTITKLDSFPEYLNKNVDEDSLEIYCNGMINYQLKGVHAETSVIWRYAAPAGTGDTHYSIMRGTKANLIIRQGKEEKFRPTLYIEPVGDPKSLEATIATDFEAIQKKFPGMALNQIQNGWIVIIPEQYREGHEAHFARVTQKFLEYLKNNNMPEWEVPNMVTKYYTTNQGLLRARGR